MPRILRNLFTIDWYNATVRFCVDFLGVRDELCFISLIIGLSLQKLYSSLSFSGLIELFIAPAQLFYQHDF